MECTYYGSWNAARSGWCGGAGDPALGGWVMADLEDGLWACNASGAVNPRVQPATSDFVVGMVKGGGGDFWGIKAGDGARGALVELWAGPRPRGYFPMRKQVSDAGCGRCVGRCVCPIWGRCACAGLWRARLLPPATCHLHPNRSRAPPPPQSSPTLPKGSLILGIGGDNSNSAVGVWFEGVVTASLSSDAQDDALMRDIVGLGLQLA